LIRLLALALSGLLLHLQSFTCVLSVPGHLELSTAHWKLKPNTSARQLPVHLRIRIQPIVNSTSLLLVQHNLHHFASVLLCARPLAHNLNWVDNIRQDRIMDGGQGTRSGSFLGLAGAGAVGALWAREDAARGEDEDVAVGKLLFKLAG
jgi:hypothetical protein